jgi:hypothetical protein
VAAPKPVELPTRKPKKKKPVSEVTKIEPPSWAPPESSIKNFSPFGMARDRVKVTSYTPRSKMVAAGHRVSSDGPVVHTPHVIGGTFHEASPLLTAFMGYTASGSSVSGSSASGNSTKASYVADWKTNENKRRMALVYDAQSLPPPRETSSLSELDESSDDDDDDDDDDDLSSEA